MLWKGAWMYDRLSLEIKLPITVKWFNSILIDHAFQFACLPTFDPRSLKMISTSWMGPNFWNGRRKNIILLHYIWFSQSEYSPPGHIWRQPGGIWGSPCLRGGPARSPQRLFSLFRFPSSLPLSLPPHFLPSLHYLGIGFPRGRQRRWNGAQVFKQCYRGIDLAHIIT